MDNHGAVEHHTAEEGHTEKIDASKVTDLKKKMDGRALPIDGSVEIEYVGQLMVNAKTFEALKNRPATTVTVNTLPESFGTLIRRYLSRKPNTVFCGYEGLPAEIKNKINQLVHANRPDRMYDLSRKGSFSESDLAWARTMKENYREMIPMVFSDYKMSFTIWDFDFSYAVSFLSCISGAARNALLTNDNLYIDLRFSGDVVNGNKMGKLRKWLEILTWTTYSIAMKPFSGLRFPFKYVAYERDQWAHMDAEARYAQWGRDHTVPGEYDAEWEVIKAEFHDAAYEQRN